MTSRHIPAKNLLAAALLQLTEPSTGKRLIPHEDAKLMTADQIISLFERDHYPYRYADHKDEPWIHDPWNITWRLRAEHREKFARDQAEMAKSRRLRKRLALPPLNVLTINYQDLRRKGYPMRKRKIPSRPFPKGRKFNHRRKKR